MRKKLRLLNRRMATERNEGNKDKAVRQHEKEVTRKNKTHKNRQHTTLNSTLKIVSRNEVVNLDNLVASAPLCGVRSYLNHHHQRPILTLLV